MNTVLDDNKKLCLTSGEIIKLTPWMTMMFEVADLAVASPATVSRCGMVFLETKQLGWFALVKTFVANLPECLHKYRDQILLKSQYLLNGTLAWTRKYGKFLVHQSEMTFVNTYLQLMKAYTKPYYEEDAKVPK
jgi:dynein heavy chain